MGHYADINKTFADVKPETYDAVYCAGGRGPEYIRTDKRVQAIVKYFHESGKPIFTICHGCQILMAVPGVLKGRKLAGLGACEPEITAVGGIYIDVKPTEAYVDGNMVSAKGWTGLAAFMRECLKVLGTTITHS
jgi:protease I